ncbi:MAG: hypothetical protein E6J90_22500 [Deltaproteobacteria bacterium]|nr:MAG: hypothetical protein E6J91_23590 [Deltaproteobacteria bacterium]TMQ17323.1 MAG: hypothetical protein E6J90_22500 [Deltaproteobacteria bacterium]
MTLVTSRLEALVIARAHAQVARLPLGELLAPLARFMPAELTAGAWRDRLAEVVAALRADGVLDADHRVREGELERRIGGQARTWPELSDRVLPGLALGIAADDAKARARLDGRDAWAAAIVGRALGLWHDGPPPSIAAMCDALVWREHGLISKPKRCPPELRAVYVQRRLGTDAGPPERLVRVLAAREVGAPRPELRALRDALVRGWLAGRVPGPASDDASRAAATVRGAAQVARGDDGATEAAQPAGTSGGRSMSAGGAARDDGGNPGPVDVIDPAAFAGEVVRAAAATTEGWFGDRKVFVSAVWDQLRREPRWSGLALAEFKARLLAAHRAGALTLARADLVAAMDPALVAASEIAADGASFHFLVLAKEPAS